MRGLQSWLWKSQTWPRAARTEFHFARLLAILQHAMASVPYYRHRFAAERVDARSPLTWKQWQRVPLLTRRDIQSAGSSIHSSQVPFAHGKTFCTLTGGSTGQPVRTVGTQLTAFAWQAFALRDHFWHQRDFRLKLASIRHSATGKAGPPDGKQVSSWGSTVSPYLKTGPGAVLAIESTVEQQVAWLMQQQPHYLLGYPSSIAAIARAFSERSKTLANLREVRTFGEVVDPEVRELCRQAWGADLVDLYSTQELGYIALQCPAEETYHVQEENVFLEVLRDDGEPAAPGQIGRVVITSLLNFAMPLIRYDLGDYAEAGGPCACGRTLRTLKRIVGRQRNMLLLPNGDQMWPALSFDQHGGPPAQLSAVKQMQVVQENARDLRVNLVVDDRLNSAGESRLRSFINSCLPTPFNIQLSYVDHVPRSPSRKFEDFRSEVTSGGSHESRSESNCRVRREVEAEVENEPSTNPSKIETVAFDQGTPPVAEQFS